jgi:hypothetical protein
MSSHRPVGLIASGRMIESPLGRLPSLAREIGPIVSSSLRLASRYANALRAGKAAALEDLAGCRLVVVQAPAPAAAEWAFLLIRQKLVSRACPCAFLGADPGPAALEALHDHRAPVAVAMFAPSQAGPALVAEGDPAALTALRSWTRRAQLPLVALRRGYWPAFDAAMQLAGFALPAVLDAATASLRAAGLSQIAARRMLDSLASAMLAGHRPPGPGTKARASSRARQLNLEQQLRTLFSIDPALSAFHRQVMEAAVHLAQPRPAQFRRGAG